LFAAVPHHTKFKVLCSLWSHYPVMETAIMKPYIFALASLVAGTTSAAPAQFVHDPPWNAEHINHLPAEIRGAVLGKSPTRPDAGHYFATFYHDEVHLHFEHLHCAGTSFSSALGCLHETYRLSSGHHRLVESTYKSGND
jgi:hypothetical protein